MAGDDSILTFEVDGRDCIAAVSDNWDAFALANEGEGACASYVLGRPWTHFVAGDEVRLLYTTLLDKVRKTRLHLTVPFRCDGPNVRRYMTMTVVPRQRNAVLFRCELRLEEPRIATPLLARNAPRGLSMLTLCGWCGNAKVGGQWIELDAAIGELRLLEAAEMPLLSHGICPTCEARFDTLNDDQY